MIRLSDVCQMTFDLKSQCAYFMATTFALEDNCKVYLYHHGEANSQGM